MINPDYKLDISTIVPKELHTLVENGPDALEAEKGKLVAYFGTQY